MPACSLSPHEAPIADRNLALEEDQGIPGESIAPEMLDLRITLDHPIAADGTIGVGEEEVIAVLLESGSVGVANVEARVSTGVDEARSMLSQVALDGRAPARLAFTPEELELPAQRLAWSSHIAFSARLGRDEGGYAAAQRIELWLHRDGDGWLLYDTAVRDARFEGGALDEGARAAWERISTRAIPGSSTDGPPLGIVTDAPLGWLPDDEAPPAEGEVER